MALNLCFGEFNFGGYVRVLPQYMILACLILAKAHQFAKISSHQNYPLYGTTSHYIHTYNMQLHIKKAGNPYCVVIFMIPEGDITSVNIYSDPV